jgi:hypothetical protein
MRDLRIPASPWGHEGKAVSAAKTTTVPQRWIAQQLKMGSAISNQLYPIRDINW